MKQLKGYFSTLKRGLGPAFSAHFLHVFFHKKVPLCRTFLPSQVSKQDVS